MYKLRRLRQRALIALSNVHPIEREDVGLIGLGHARQYGQSTLRLMREFF
jgi:hypothetical protein